MNSIGYNGVEELEGCVVAERGWVGVHKNVKKLDGAMGPKMPFWALNCATVE